MLSTTAGRLTVTANGDVTGTNNIGIFSLNTYYGTALNVTTGPGTTVKGGYSGIIRDVNFGAGALSVTANGDVTGGSDGIYARNIYGTGLTVTTGAGTTVKGGYYGVYARNFGTGGLTVTANGDVAGATNTVWASLR